MVRLLLFEIVSGTDTSNSVQFDESQSHQSHGEKVSVKN